MAGFMNPKYFKYKKGELIKRPKRGRPKGSLNKNRVAGPKKVGKVMKNTSNVTRMPLGLTERLNVTLSYSDIADSLVAGPTSFYQSALFSMTNLVDPDISGGGYQSPLFDNLKLLYNRWRVNSCKITVHCENYTNSPCMLTLVGLYDPNTNTPTVPENPGTYDLMALNTKERSNRYRINALQSGNGNSVVFSKTFYPKDFIGSEYFTSVNFAGQNNTAPAHYPTIALIAQSCHSGAASEIGMFMSWRVEYDVTFFQPIETEIAAYD